MSDPSNSVVLVADDEPSTLALLSRHLRAKGYSVLEASDGDEAWELAHEHLPHLVILDVMMPGMSGWEVCRKIREAVSLAHTGVIMLTGIGENLNEMTSPLYGADAHLDKPFEFPELDRRVRETLERRDAGALGRADGPDAGHTVRSAPDSSADLDNGADSEPAPALRAPKGERRAAKKLTPADSPKQSPKPALAKAVARPKPEPTPEKRAAQPPAKKAAPPPRAAEKSAKTAAPKAAEKSAKTAAPKPAKKSAKAAAPKAVAPKAAKKSAQAAAPKAAAPKAAKKSAKAAAPKAAAPKTAKKSVKAAPKAPKKSAKSSAPKASAPKASARKTAKGKAAAAKPVAKKSAKPSKKKAPAPPKKAAPKSKAKARR